MNPDKKKIIFVTVRSDLGGGPYHIDLLLTNLFAFFEFYIAAPLNIPYGHKWQEQFGKNKFFELPFRSFNVIRFFRLISFIRNNSIGIVHSHGKGAGLYSRLVKLFIPEIKVIHTFHGLHIQEYNFVTRKIYILLERLLSNLTGLYINVSKGEKKVCLHHRIFDEKKSVVVYNAINSIESPSMDKTEIRHKLSLPEEKFLIISVLRFSYQKNLSLLINIAEQLNQNEKFSFIIIGDGEQRASVEEQIASKNIGNINLLGFRNNVIEYLFASDIYLSTSFWEGMPYSLIEAAGCGLPIVATNVIGNDEVVSDGENGYLFELNNPGIAVKKILELESSPDQKKTMEENSLKIVMDNFQLSTMINRMKEIYTG